MKTEAAAFVDWFEKERERTIDRILKMLGEEAYEGIGCGLVMELHQQALTATAVRVAAARACQWGSAAAAHPFSGYKAYRDATVQEAASRASDSPAPEKRRGPGRKQKASRVAEALPALFPMGESEEMMPRTGG